MEDSVIEKDREQVQKEKCNTSMTIRKDKNKIHDINKLSKDEKAARALSVIATEERQTLQIGAIGDPITPGKTGGRKRTTTIQKNQPNFQ